MRSAACWRSAESTQCIAHDGAVAITQTAARVRACICQKCVRLHKVLARAFSSSLRVVHRHASTRAHSVTRCAFRATMSIRGDDEKCSNTRSATRRGGESRRRVLVFAYRATWRKRQARRSRGFSEYVNVRLEYLI